MTRLPGSQERETGSIIQYDEENDEEFSIDGYTIWANKTGGEAIWNLPNSADDFIKVLQQIEWVQSDSEDEPDTIGADEMDFTDSTGSGSTVYNEEDNEITDYEEFQGEGSTELIHLESSNKPGHIKIIFKNQKYVLFENNGEDQYLVKFAEESIGLLKNYEDVLVCVRLLLGK